MLLIISPAKKLDFSPVEIKNKLSNPIFQKDASTLAGVASKLSKSELGQLMSISEKLADLNFKRFQNFKTNPEKISSKAAAFAFNGDTYNGLNISEFSELDLKFSQKHLRILSGLYGLLRPLDIIQPYRLEMGSHLKNKRGDDLYHYWSNTISNHINLDLKEFKKLCSRRKIEGLVIGNPLDMHGKETNQSIQCKNYGIKLAKCLDLPLVFINDHWCHIYLQFWH